MVLKLISIAKNDLLDDTHTNTMVYKVSITSSYAMDLFYSDES